MDTRDHNEYEMVLKKLKEFRSPSSFKILKIFHPTADVIDWNTISQNTIPAFSWLAVFFGFTTHIGRAHRIGKKGISVSRFAQPAWFDFHWSTCFSSIQKPSSHPTGKIWPSVYKRQRCSYNDEKWVDAMMNNGMWDKLISLTLLGVDVRSADIFADFAMDARPSDIQVGWVVTHQLWNGKKPAHGYPSGTAHWNIDLWLVRLKDVYKKFSQCQR